MSVNKVTARTITAIVIGNALEWYDFIVYSFMTVYIAKLFFPSTDHFVSLLMATATFGVAFLMRPLGGIMIGLYADTYGRKAAITLVMMLMTIAIALIAFTPTYNQIGSTASFILLSARMLQGLSAGGEFGPSSAALVELSPPNRRGLIGAWQMVGQMCASLLASSIGMLVLLLTPAQVESWGWRIPFLLGLVIAPVGIYIRNHLDLNEIDNDLMKNSSEKTVLINLCYYWRELFTMMGLVVGGTVAVYANISYFPTYAVKVLHQPIQYAFIAIFIGTLFRLFLSPIYGWLSDKGYRKRILVTSLVVYIVSIFPIYLFLSYNPSLIKFILAQIIVGVIMSGLDGVFVSIVTDLFPLQIRSTALSIGYNVTVMLFGGFAQFIVTWLIHVTGDPLAIAYYLIATNLISLVAACCYKEKGMNNEFSGMAYQAHRV